jgi:lipopolysaccharide export system protein LptA
VPKKAETKDPAAVTASAAAGGPQMFEASDAPLDITASRLDVKDTEKTAIFTGNVKALQNDQSLVTQELTVTYDGDQTGSGPDAAQTAVPPSPATGKIHRIIAKGPVVLERGPLEKVTADSMDFDATAQSGSLIGNVVMQSGADRQATSDRADLDQKASTVLLTGNVFVQQAKNELKGGRLFIDRNAGHAVLTSPAGSGPAAGRIAARLIRGDGAEKTKGKTKLNAGDAGDAGSVGSFKTDPNAPIDIDADQLDVNDKQKNAVFRGNVKAVQGEFVIKTPELVATYSGDMQLADVTATTPDKTPGAKKSSTELTHIRANTKVNVTSKDGQSVDGDWADYDAKANTVVVGGEVVLAKGGSMVRGTRLVIDMTSGQSTIETAPGKAVALPGGGGWSTTAPVEGEASNRGRPSAVFFPRELQEGSKDKKDKGAKEDPAVKGSSWKAGTTPPDKANAEPASN